MFFACIEQCFQQMPLISEWMIEFPTKFAFVINAQQTHVTGKPDRSRLDAKPWKCLVGQINLCQRLQNLARLRADDGEAATIIGNVSQSHATVLRQKL
ncbi:hypothetical protein D3C87_1940160 [compost metagenome]